MKRIMKRTWGRWLAGLLSVAMVLTLLPATALAAEYYTLEKGTEEKEATSLTDNSSSWTEDVTSGWYVVDSNVTISDRVTVSGDVNLILADGCTLTASQGITVNQENSLTIWGQTEGSGRLIATGGSEWQAGIGSDGQTDKCGAININGGTIKATGGGWTAGIGGKEATITINGGKVTAIGGDNGAGIGGIGDTGSCNITITGGIIEAHGGSGGDGAGIGAGASGSCNVTISGGTINAYGGEGRNADRDGGPGIGAEPSKGTVVISGGFVEAVGGKKVAGIRGDFSTGSESAGKAVIVCNNSGIEDTTPTDKWSGIFVNSNTQEMSVYGEQALTKELSEQFPSVQFSPVTLNIKEGATLTVNDGVNVTLTGESTIAENGILNDNGSITNEGLVTNRGTINTNNRTIVNKGNIKNYGTINKEEDITGNPLCTDCKLTVDALNFSASTGYTPSEEPIPIYNGGKEPATIEEVKLEPSSGNFVLIEGENKEVEAGQTDTSWMIKPVADLPGGSYSGTITITYNGMEATSIDVPVTFTVYTPAAPSTTVNRPVTDTGSGETTVTVNTRSTTSGSTAKASVTSSAMNRAVDSAVNEAARQGTVPVVEVDVRTSSRADSLNVTLPTDPLEELAEAEDSSLVIVSDIADVALDNTALSALAAQATGNTVVLEVTPVAASELSEAQAETVDEAPVEDVSMVSNGVAIHDYHGGRITVTLPYKLAEGQSASDVVVYYLDDAGTLTPCATSYDSEAEEVTFVTVHLSKYVIGDSALGEEKDCPSEKFTDLDTGAWYHDYTDYVIVHGLMNGIGGGLFGPGGAVTRAQMVMVLWNMSDKPVVNYYMTYSDVSEDAWYAEAIRWATSEGIVGGYGNGKFGPGDPITREQMAAMMYRYEQKYGGGGFTGDWMYRLPFTDLDQISDWAFEAVAWCNMKSVMSGKSDNIFDPKGPAKRSEMAAVLTRYCGEKTGEE